MHICCVQTCRDGKLMDNYFSCEMVLSITYQKHRKPSTSHRPHIHEGSVEGRVACRKSLSQCL